ncbi:S-layer family protein [Phormidium tenue FACHB-886]|nr:S-layer family protein [Phormidium tenue FACHB-886]
MKCCRRSFYQLSSLLGSFVLAASSVQAQIVPDTTLRNASSVSQEGSASIITGGTQEGNNLFHSFREFSVPEGGAASFRQIDRETANIITRVTGSSASRINGMIEILNSEGDRSTANFFLINPHGIIFGPNASLNVGGSFLATTANSIRFADGSEFSAVQPQNAPLLTVSLPVGLQFGNHPGSIVNRSTAPLLDSAGNPVADFFGDPVQGLSVSPGHTLAFVGGNLSFEAGALNTYGGLSSTGGRIELGSVASPDQVSLTPIAGGWRLGYDAVSNLGNIQLLQSTLNASGAGGGGIQIQGDRLSMAEASEIVADTFGALPGKGILIEAASLRLDGSRITAETYGLGSAGDIRIETDQLLALNGSQIVVNTVAGGQGGNLRIRASDSIDLVGGVDFPISGLYARGNDSAAVGQAGTISISANRIRVLRGAQINADNEGSGDVGIIRVRASDIALSGIARSSKGEPLLVFGVPQSPSALSAFAYPSSSGGGEIDVRTQRLRLQDGAVIQITTTGSGNAGDLQIHANESIELAGFAIGGREAPTGLLTFSGGIPGTLYDDLGVSSATGQGGNLVVSTNQLIVRDRAVVAVGSLNPNLNARGAGNLRIRASTIRLEDQGNLLAATASGNGGNITLRALNLLLLNNNSQISATAGTASAGGNGGNIHIDADYLIAAPLEDSNIEANAFTGAGGRINIDVLGIVGIEQRDRPSPLSDITASSEFGISGSVQINTLADDPNQGLVELPTAIVDASQSVAQTCATAQSTTAVFNEFVVTGRGGLPPSPSDQRQSEAVLTSWATLGSQENFPAPAISQMNDPIHRRSPAPHSSASNSQSLIVEAQGWAVNEEGELMLVTQVPIATSNVGLFSTLCNSQ